MTDSKRGNVWVFIEQEDGRIADVSLELVSKACELAAELGVKTEGVLLGADVESLITRLHEQGCDNVFWADDGELKLFSALPYTKVIAQLARDEKPDIILFGATRVGRSLAPRVASELQAGLTADCTALRIDDFEDKAQKRTLRNKLMQIRPAFGGNIIATIVNSWDGPQMVTVREGVMPMGEAKKGRTGEVVKMKVALDPADTVVKFVERIREDSENSLKNAQIIVAGGYGVGGAEAFKLVRELADTLGAAVAASRAAVDAGWIDHDHQVGQTGITVRPRMYIACGISGSVQHRAGMSESAKILAINTDADAPIFSIANYGIVGDLKVILPKLIAAYKKRS